MSGAAFIDAGGRGQHSWPRSLGTLALTVGGTAATLVPVRLALFPWLKANAADMPEPIRSGVLALAAGVIFLGALAGLSLGVRWLHRRPAISVVTTASRFRWSHFGFAFLLSGSLVGVGGWLLDPESMKPLDEFEPRVVAFAVVALLAGFVVQASAEEVFFRGWLLQVGRRALRSRWAAAAVSVALFGLAHFGYGVESGISSLMTAAALTACVVLLGGLEFAMGAHVANNFVVALLFQDLARANAPSASGFDLPMLAADGTVALILVIAAALLRARRPTP